MCKMVKYSIPPKKRYTKKAQGKEHTIWHKAKLPIKKDFVLTHMRIHTKTIVRNINVKSDMAVLSISKFTQSHPPFFFFLIFFFFSISRFTQSHPPIIILIFIFGFTQPHLPIIILIVFFYYYKIIKSFFFF